jgi:cellulose synthase/poly-beta-1,6-N-acetylglucosamine synthase-like glycosyltransferase
MMAVAVFWATFACIVYVYLGYPLLLLTWRKLCRRPVNKEYRELSVSLVIAMHNERQNVQAKMQNCLELDYPADQLQVIVSLDAPTDGTDILLEPYASHVRIIHCPVRGGKAAALNSGMAAATGEIVVFGDAEQLLEKSAIRELVANFADPSVGAVSGELFIVDRQGRETADGMGLYWRYEKKLRAMESDIHSVPGTTGAIYAIRRSLFTPLAPGTILDDVLTPMRIILKGKRVTFDPSARAYGLMTQDAAAEYETKKRTLAGNYQLLVEAPELLIPWRNPIFVQLVSHKLGRLIVPYCLVALLVSNLFLTDGLYRTVLVLQILWYVMACIGGWVTHRRRSSTYSAGLQEMGS